jgi:hypothetical protein
MAHPYTIPFRNDSGEEIPPFGVMRPRIFADTATEIIDRDGQWCVSVVKPDTKFSRRYLINGSAAVPIAGYGMAADGFYPVLALRENETVECGDGWGVQPSSWKLKRYSPGKFTIYAASGQNASGDYRALFSQVECNELIVQGTAALTGASTVTANICRGLPATTETTIQVTIRDLQFPGGEVYPDDTLYAVSWRNGAWYVDWFDECPV